MPTPPIGGYGEQTYGGYNVPTSGNIPPGVNPNNVPGVPQQGAGGVNYGSPYQNTPYSSPYTDPGYGGQGEGGGILDDIWSGVSGAGEWLWENVGQQITQWLLGGGEGGGEGYLGDLLGGAGMAALTLMTVDQSSKAGANREELLKQAMGTSTKEIAQGDKSTTMGNISTSQGLEAMLGAVNQGPQMFAPPNLRDMNNPYAGNYGSAAPPPLQGAPTGWLAEMIGSMSPPTPGGGGGPPTPPLQGPIIPQPNVPQPSGSGDPWPTPIPIQPNDPRRTGFGAPAPQPPPMPMGLPSSIPMGGQPPGMPQPMPMPTPTAPQGEMPGMIQNVLRSLGAM